MRDEGRHDDGGGEGQRPDDASGRGEGGPRVGVAVALGRQPAPRPQRPHALPPDEGQPEDGRGQQVPGGETGIGVRRGREEGGEQRDAGERRVAVRDRDRVGDERGEADEQAHREHDAAV
ncbi:hypothetical protein PDTK01_01410 [Phycicoccus sp. DTK01]|nr:hypothetical protein [Phycicoccus sp. DTK01]GIL34064.1 hypothetical protein PDTK01_01410 [Phycicoccus sp. DTK01]